MDFQGIYYHGAYLSNLLSRFFLRLNLNLGSVDVSCLSSDTRVRRISRLRGSCAKVTKDIKESETKPEDKGGVLVVEWPGFGESYVPIRIHMFCMVYYIFIYQHEGWTGF